MKFGSPCKKTIILQARTGSHRLSKKVLRKIQGRPLISYVINRVKKTRNVDQIILATTRRKEDNVLLKIAMQNGIKTYSGDNNDVLNRYFQCALVFKADPIIRITGDCPLIDPLIIEEILEFYLNHNYDYVSNTIIPTYPDGLDVEIFSFKALKTAFCLAKKKSDREHVTPYIKRNSNKFKLHNYRNKKNLSLLRWTVDEEIDLKMARKIYQKMKPKTIFSMIEILQMLSKYPKISDLNKGIKRNEGYLKSLKKDKKKS